MIPCDIFTAEKSNEDVDLTASHPGQTNSEPASYVKKNPICKWILLFIQIFCNFPLHHSFDSMFWVRCSTSLGDSTRVRYSNRFCL